MRLQGVLRPARPCNSIGAVSIDMSGGYEKAIRENLPDST
jgi:hypothetical protein